MLSLMSRPCASGGNLSKTPTKTSANVSSHRRGGGMRLSRSTTSFGAQARCVDRKARFFSVSAPLTVSPWQADRLLRGDDDRLRHGEGVGHCLSLLWIPRMA